MTANMTLKRINNEYTRKIEKTKYETQEFKEQKF